MPIIFSKFPNSSVYLSSGVYLLSRFIVLPVFSFSILFLASASAFVSPSIVYASTDIRDGRLRSDTYWTKANSPYILYDYLDVLEGNSFTIGPGVTIMSASTSDSWQEPYSIYTGNHFK